MADTKTYLKVPYRDRTLRTLPFNGGHLTALTMAQQMRDDKRKLNTVFRILNALLGDDAYETVTNDLVDGAINVQDLMELLEGIVKATANYTKSQSGSNDPEPVIDNGLDSDHGRE